VPIRSIFFPQQRGIIVLGTVMTVWLDLGRLSPDTSSHLAWLSDSKFSWKTEIRKKNLQFKPFNVITLRQRKTDNIDGMITIKELPWFNNILKWNLQNMITISNNINHDHIKLLLLYFKKVEKSYLLHLTCWMNLLTLASLFAWLAFGWAHDTSKEIWFLVSFNQNGRSDGIGVTFV
jgi:hypothetical protein